MTNNEISEHFYNGILSLLIFSVFINKKVFSIFFNTHPRTFFYVPEDA